jgi:hypothetical protein
MWRKKNRWGKLGIILISFGVLLLICQIILISVGISLVGIDLIGWLLGVLAVGLAFLAIGMSIETDKKYTEILTCPPQTAPVLVLD